MRIVIKNAWFISFCNQVYMYTFNMSLACRAIFRNCYYLHNITKPVKWSVGRNYTTRILASGICYQDRNLQRWETQQINLFHKPLRQCSTKQGPVENTPQENENKGGLIKRLKQMYKDYWYVVLPVHFGTSCIWFGSFYYAVRSGVDVIGLLQTLGISESLISPLRESSAGYFALALALYKLVSPLRYAVTVGGTTYAIKKLTTMGWIKPVPSRERLKEMYQEKKENIQDRFNEGKQQYQTMREKKRAQVMEEMKRYKSEMRNFKNKSKTKE